MTDRLTRLQAGVVRAGRWRSGPPLEAALPLRHPGEALLPWLGRCQRAALEAALSKAASEDRNLSVSPTRDGWLVVHRTTGQRVEVVTSAGVGREHPR